MKLNSLAVLVWLSVFGLLFNRAGAQGIAGPTNGLVCYYRFNGNANDALGRGNAGVLYNGAYYTNGIGGQPNGAVWCNGAGGYVYMGKNEAVYPNQTLTWSVWVRLEDIAAGPVLWDDDGQNGGDRGISVLPTLILGGGLFINAPPAEAPLTAPGQLTARVWHQLAYTSDGSGQSLYVDGVPAAARNRILMDHAGRSSLSFGAGNASFTGPITAYAVGFKGAISQARIYQRALSAFEVATLYNAESGLAPAASGARVLVHRAAALSFSNLVVGVAYQIQAASLPQGPFTNFSRPFVAGSPTVTAPGFVNIEGTNQLFFRVEKP